MVSPVKVDPGGIYGGGLCMVSLAGFLFALSPIKGFRKMVAWWV